jgi:hypothetical protein
MAIVIGHPAQKPLRSELITFMLLLAAPLLVAALMPEWTGGKDSPAMAASVGAALLLLTIVAYWRLNPLVMQRIFRPATFKRHIVRHNAVIDSLARLEDDCVVFNNLIIELLSVEHLVVSTRGIFVIGKVHQNGPLRVVDNSLFAGSKRLERLTVNTWRLCHLIAIILKKWFKIDHMPQPVLVVDYRQGGPDEYDGIAIVADRDLPEYIRRFKPVLTTETAGGLVHFLKRRYAGLV